MNIKLKWQITLVLGLSFSICTYAQCSDLKNFPKGSEPQEVGTRLVKKFLQTPNTRFGRINPISPPTYITYPDVCTWLGSLWFADALNDKGMHQQLEDRFEPLLNTQINMQPIPNHVDNNVFGALPLELYKENKKQGYLELGMKYADTQWNLPQNAKPEEKAWAEKGYSWQSRIWIDDMFMITSVQAQAYLVTHDKKYINRAAHEMCMYLNKIQRPNGLFYHTPETPFFWGRGNGWMAFGMCELLRTLPKNNPDRKTILKAYQKMMGALLQYQTKDGMWRQLIDNPASWKETSGTAMFTYAMITGVKNGWLNNEIYGSASRKAWLSLITYINKDDELTDVCEGTDSKNNYQYYLDRKRITGDLHGQAPVIWCAVALLR
ncbi:MAG: glycoside hydrolase family 88 protein [Paludibacter sp.]|nr:glycoside hydrolase family 88 protein [Paludibacter sp.]